MSQRVRRKEKRHEENKWTKEKAGWETMQGGNITGENTLMFTYIKSVPVNKKMLNKYRISKK